jgi:endoglucanase
MATSQMQHFVNTDGFNVFRLPTAWQPLVNNDLEANVLDATYFAKYNAIVDVCLQTSPDTYCM